MTPTMLRRALALLALVTLPAADVAAQALRLIPAPREVSTPAAPLRFRATIAFGAIPDAEDRMAARDLVDVMRERGIRAELSTNERAWTVALLHPTSDAGRQALRAAQV